VRVAARADDKCTLLPIQSGLFPGSHGNQRGQGCFLNPPLAAPAKDVRCLARDSERTHGPSGFHSKAWTTSQSTIGVCTRELPEIPTPLMRSVFLEGGVVSYNSYRRLPKVVSRYSVTPMMMLFPMMMLREKSPPHTVLLL
jgi:hypothetical protein